MRWASRISEEPDLDAAWEEVSNAVGDELGAPADLVLAFVSPQLAGDVAAIAERCRGAFPNALTIGCSGGGIIGGGREIEHRPALSLSAAHLPDVGVHPVRIGLGDDGDALADAIGPAGDDARGFILFPDPFSCDASAVAELLDEAYPDATKIGGLASGARRAGETALFLDGRTHHDGLVGVALDGRVRIDTIVAQGCRPIGEPMIVTRRRDHVVLETDRGTPLNVLRGLAASLPPRDRRLLSGSLFVGIQMREQRRAYRRGDFLIRGVMAIDPDTGGVAIASPLTDYMVIQFHLRDRDTSAEDLAAHLSEMADAPAPAGALLFSCLGRGEHLYGRADHDSEMFAKTFGDVPLGGFFCNGEIGPVGPTTFLHSYTSAFGLFSAP